MFKFLNIYPEKTLAGIVSGLLSYLTRNIMPLVACVLLFEIIDFITGVWKSKILARRRGEKFAFESVKAWRTIYKTVFILAGIIMSELLDVVISERDLRLANFFTAFCCGVEFWSFLENAAVISDHPLFRWLGKFMRVKVEDKIDFDKFTEGRTGHDQG
ncbi:MAG: phage holin family protein [Bacteroidia bacterium]|nr:phage holin family protein [Bacteroidia bacterium]